MVIHHFRVIVNKIVAGIVARIVALVKSFCLSLYKKVETNSSNIYLCTKFVFFFLTGHFCFPEPDWDDISEEAKDLIRGLLIKEAPKRLGAEAVLNHPWIKISENEPLDSKRMEIRRKALRTPGNIRR